MKSIYNTVVMVFRRMLCNQIDILMKTVSSRCRSVTSAHRQSPSSWSSLQSRFSELKVAMLALFTPLRPNKRRSIQSRRTWSASKLPSRRTPSCSTSLSTQPSSAASKLRSWKTLRHKLSSTPPLDSSWRFSRRTDDWRIWIALSALSGWSWQHIEVKLSVKSPPPSHSTLLNAKSWKLNWR